MGECVYCRGDGLTCFNAHQTDVYSHRCIEADNMLKSEQVYCRYKVNKKANPISHPAHYTEGRKYEPKDVIRDWGLNFNLGSAVKYLSRAGRKDDIIQDLKKAQQFIQFEIDALEEEKNNT